MDADGRAAQLEAERAALARIWQAHEAYVDKNRRMAEGLAAEAAEAIEDGIRDIIDEDAEADAAIRAALVRQSSQRAMYAARRVADLEAQGDALAFGHVTNDEGERLMVGRRTVFDQDEPVLVDWRARAAVPFYRATPVERMGIVHRRHLIYDDPTPGTDSTLVDYADEVFDLVLADWSMIDRASLRGEAALLNAIEAPTQNQMRSVVATIQAEQDAVVRAPSDRTLVVQGGPGTGKTVVALHRAAYLLYDQRDELADSGVLLVGPSKAFLRYIAGVLPSLGESGVVAVTVPALYRGAPVTGTDDAEVANLKGEQVMADVLRTSIDLRQRAPSEPLKVWYGSRSVRLDLTALDRIFATARRHRHHNDGAATFRSLVIERLSAEVFDPSFHNLADARETFAASPEVRRFTLAHFPPLSPEQALNDLLGSQGLLRAAADKAGLQAATGSDGSVLYRPRTPERELRSAPWTQADMALLDELHALLGPVRPEAEDGPAERRDEDDEFERAIAEDDERQAEAAERASERPDETGDVDLAGAGLMFDDPFWEDYSEGDYDIGEEPEAEDAEGEDPGAEEFRGVVESDGEPIGELDLESLDAEDEEQVNIAELAALEQSWQFGHVIVDEAQDLNPMQWRMVVRRSGSDALTIVGDLAQRSTGAAASSWLDLLPESLSGATVRELTVNYRSPRELDEVAHRVLATIAPNLQPASALRSSGTPIKIHSLASPATIESTLASIAQTVQVSGPESGQLAIVAAEPNPIAAAFPNHPVLTPAEAKGLEFDTVIVVEPASIVASDHGLNLLYVALTRATAALHLVHCVPLPEVLLEDIAGLG